MGKIGILKSSDNEYDLERILKEEGIGKVLELLAFLLVTLTPTNQ